MAEFDGLTTFRKSGYQRIRDAEHLLTPPLTDTNERGATQRHMRGAMYLSGYGVECLLKAFLIAQHPPLQRLNEVLSELRRTDPGILDICGASGHNLTYLLTLTGLEERMNNERRAQMGLCAKWRSSWRYNAEPDTLTNATDMVHSARSLAEWINSQI